MRGKTQMRNLAVAGLLVLMSGNVQAAPLEETDIFEMQTAIDEALRQEAMNDYTLEEALIAVNPYGTSPLTAVAVFSTPEEVGGMITVKGKASENDITGTFPAATEHIVPIYGLYNDDTTQVVISLEDGTEAVFDITTEAIPADYGTIEAEVFQEELYDYSEMTFISSMAGTLYGVDAAGDIRFFTDAGGAFGVGILENGHLMMPSNYILKTNYYKEGLIEVDLNGRIYRQYEVPGGQHHDWCELPDGNIVVASDSPDFSTIEDYVVELDRESGDVVWELDMKDLLPLEDGASASMDSDGSAESDWFHNNGLCYDREQDLILLSARHKDAIVAVSREDKSLAWILGDPEGWEEVDPALFFTPEGEDFEWFYAQHHVSMLDNGDVMLFDNGTAKVKRVNNDQRVTGDDVYSRAVAYHLTQDHTVSQVMEYGKERGADWYADWVSGVVSLDGTADHVWITAGSHLHSEAENRSDFYPADMFRQDVVRMTHIDQVDEGELTYELTLSGDVNGALSFRSFRMPMYAEGMTLDTQITPQVLGSLGETAYESCEVDTADAVELAENDCDLQINLTLDTKKLALTGSYGTDLAVEEVEGAALVLVGDTQQRKYGLASSAAAGEKQTRVSLTGWVSLEGLQDADWEIYLLLGDKLYRTDSSI